MMAELLLIALGLLAGTLSGLVGIGGGVLIVPTLIYLFKFSQHQAQGTTLALMVPPIGLLAAWTYYKSGYVDVKAAVLICLGFLVGAWLGSKYAVGLPELMLKRIFGVTLLVLALRMILSR